MKISRVEIFTAHLPLDREISRFGGKISHLEELYIKLTGEDGAAGWGEARGNAAHISGETPAGMEYVFKELLAPLVIGKELRGRAAVLSLVHRAVEGNGGAKSALDTALHDLAARAAGVPLYLWFGGKRLPDVKGSACIAFCSPGEAAERAHEYAGQGFANLMIRVGGESFSEDLERVKAVRDAAGEGISLAVDSGQAWTAKQAVGRIRMLEAFDIECAEQPVKARDFTGMAEVARGTRVALMADESLGTLEDGMNLIRLGAAGMFHIQLSRAGGVLPGSADDRACRGRAPAPMSWERRAGACSPPWPPPIWLWPPPPNGPRCPGPGASWMTRRREGFTSRERSPFRTARAWGWPRTNRSSSASPPSRGERKRLDENFAGKIEVSVPPEFPASEYESRWRRARAAMEMAGVAGLLLTSEANYRYFSGHFSRFFWVSKAQAGRFSCSFPGSASRSC